MVVNKKCILHPNKYIVLDLNIKKKNKNLQVHSWQHMIYKEKNTNNFWLCNIMQNVQPTTLKLDLNMPMFICVCVYALAG